VPSGSSARKGQKNTHDAGFLRVEILESGVCWTQLLFSGPCGVFGCPEHLELIRSRRALFRLPLPLAIAVRGELP
jgi:hypothetical protein